MTEPARTATNTGSLDDAAFPADAMGPAAKAIGVTPGFLRAAETAGLFESHRSEGGHRRYSRDDLRRADRARHLVDEGLRMDAVVRIIDLEYQLAAASAMIEILRQRLDRRQSSPPAD
ncbi:MerR family transcriptional regulator [Catellatospora vulcania]|uniref:MerR family transcriptional regulator n=1 Tax=Catellatospora vulcania TaxID=1460450 RepID=UPI0012D4A7E5|nr:MerR family transcriptional regulator [Catellatospora vulcania]